MTYRLSPPFGRRCREAARGCYRTAMDANIRSTESTETPEERERLLSRSLPRVRKRIEDTRARSPANGGRSD